MSPLAWFNAAKVYLAVGAIAALAILAGVQTVRLASSQSALADFHAAAAQLEVDRARTALADALRTSEKMAAHAATQQGLTDELTKETALRRDAERRNGELGRGLRDAFAAFDRDRKQAKADAAVAGGAGDRPEAVVGLFGEAGELLARSADLQEEARSIVTRRDSEVKALKAQVAADRALLEE